MNPLQGMSNRAQPETSETPVAEPDDIAAVLATCSGENLEHTRDAASIYMLRCTGVRRGELVGPGVGRHRFRHEYGHLRNETVRIGEGRTVTLTWQRAER